MKSEIKAYLTEHGERYTPEALRAHLIEAGHDPGDVDEALAEWRAADAPGNPSGNDRRAFRWWALGFHVAALAIVALALLPRGDSVSYIGAGPVIVILAVFLFIGWGLSTALGGWILRRATLAVALVLPVLSAVLIGGTCLAMVGGL